MLNTSYHFNYVVVKIIFRDNLIYLTFLPKITLLGYLMSSKYSNNIFISYTVFSH